MFSVEYHFGHVLTTPSVFAKNVRIVTVTHDPQCPCIATAILATHYFGVQAPRYRTTLLAVFEG